MQKEGRVCLLYARNYWTLQGRLFLRNRSKTDQKLLNVTLRVLLLWNEPRKGQKVRAILLVGLDQLVFLFPVSTAHSQSAQGPPPGRAAQEA